MNIHKKMQNLASLGYGQKTLTARKPTHTDQYLAFDSHHPESVKRGGVKCLTPGYQSTL